MNTNIKDHNFENINIPNQATILAMLEADVHKSARTTGTSYSSIAELRATLREEEYENI